MSRQQQTLAVAVATVLTHDQAQGRRLVQADTSGAGFQVTFPGKNVLPGPQDGDETLVQQLGANALTVAAGAGSTITAFPAGNGTIAGYRYNGVTFNWDLASLNT